MIFDMSPMLGFSMDSLGIASTFQQHSGYINSLKDSLDEEITPSRMNKNNVHSQSWVSVIAQKEGLGQSIFDPNGVFSQGKLTIRTSNYGRVIRFQNNEGFSNPTFVQGDSIEAVATSVVGDVFGYPLDDYILVQNQYTDTLSLENSITLENEIQTVPQLNTQNGNGDNEIEISWVRKPGVTSGPEQLSISLTTVVKEFESLNGFTTRFGYSINNFSAKNELEPDNLNVAGDGTLSAFQIAFFSTALLITVLVFIVGIRNIFKGKVEWRRALFVFFAISITYLGWRSIYFWSVFGDFHDTNTVFLLILNNLLTGLILGLYAAVAYISWEAFARSQKNGQVELMDAFWQRKFFVRETGTALVNGFFIGCILLGLFALILFVQNSYFSQNDSQFGFTEAAIKVRILTINMSAWSTIWLVGFAQIGFVYGFCKHWIKNSWLSIIITILFSSISLTVLGRVFATPLTFYGDFLIFIALGFLLVIVYERYGIITVNTALWVFTAVIMMMPYVGSSDIEMASTWWVQGFLVAGVPLFGFISHKYGMPVAEVGDYIPEYQERIAQHMRVEKEIEIARESQYKLMPLQPPSGEGFDVYGFFLPSFEVGGDYFDYVLTKNEDGSPNTLTMVVVDVSGKAMRAAMPAIFTSGLLLSRMKDDTPDRILTDVNEPIFTRTDKRTFITCAMAQYNLATKTISVVNAGHCKPIIKRNGAADFIQTPEPRLPLGFKSDTKYHAQEFKLKKGDVFLLYSDGLPEAANEKGERFGFDEVPRLLERIHTENLSSNEIAQEIKRTVQKFSNYQLADDTTVICLKV
ncbi:MAG: serine/threonine-protein phosphatase [Balneola sp.]|nr:MAG: serine/threonine-protein phosphatase [Balneola sp.]